MASDSPLVSIIMPAHNSEQFIGMAIDSVRAQTYQNWELIVINDQSTDRTCEIVKSYEQHDKRISLHDTDYHNGMPSAPRNTGVDLAKGRFISFLDSDDLWTNTKLDEQVPLFANENVVVVSPTMKRLTKMGKEATA
jgi:glycosyltransferase involved in cell wall biosynthesis